MMYPLLASLCYLIQLSALSLASDSPSPNPNRTLDETTDPSHGRIISPSHAVLKLDCPGCPLYNTTWTGNATALIYDFRIINDNTTIHLNTGPFFPAGNLLGFTPMTRHFALPVPSTTTIDEHLASPSRYPTAEMAAIIDPNSVPNAHGWNITRISCINFGYGEFANQYQDIPTADLYLLTPPPSSAQALSWEIIWWEIRPMQVNTTSPILPKNLETKLLHRRRGHRHGSAKGLGFSATLLVVGAGFFVVTGAAAWLNTRYHRNGKHGRGAYGAITLD